MSVEVNNESGATVDEKALADLGRFVLDALRIDPLAEVSVLLVDAETMAALHQQWMDLPGPTDVMAFPMDGADGPAERRDPSAPPGTDDAGAEAMLGDVVLCPSVAADQAASAGHSTEAELHLLCTHGILHLLGYDHGEPDEERQMFELQARLVGEWARISKHGPIRAPLPGTGGEVRDTAGGRRG
ncbi:MAG: putative rRNA maturation factor [Pseudonocardiales bacterium]|nr:putative rRNA maturation factor [Pseudonocardiales bacterium]MDT4913040.1 putative rRNA maturation factor [Pseudonocardiales bacterium]